MDRTGQSRHPIVVRWLWDDCWLVNGVRAFVVEVPIERCDGLRIDWRSVQEHAYLDRVAELAARWPGTVTEGHVTCAVSVDGRALVVVDPWLPYSSQWNGYCPLRRLGVRVSDLAELATLPTAVIQKALNDDVASTVCLEGGAWKGTELAYPP